MSRWDGAISDAELDYCKGLLSMEPPNPEEGWLAVSGAPAGMKVWGRVEEGTSTTVFRVHGKMLNVSVDSVASTMEGMDEKNRREWDSSTLTLKIIASDRPPLLSVHPEIHEERDDDIVHWITDFPWPLSDRVISAVCLLFGTDVAYGATRCSVPTHRMVLPGVRVPAQ
eukprot:3852196-Rhodomonas_salina.1